MNLPLLLTERPLSRVARYTARFHVPAAGLEGLVAGVFTLNDVILRKTFGASAVVIMLVVMAQPVSQLLAIVWGNLMQGRPKRPFILGLGGTGRLLLLLVALATTTLGFALPVVGSIALATAIIPALNSLYQANYSDRERGRIYGWIVSITALTTIVGSLGAGALMDIHPDYYRVVYPLAGLLGLGGMYYYYRIVHRTTRAVTAGASRPPLRTPGGPGEVLDVMTDWMREVLGAMKNPLRGSVSLFREDPDFLRFEVAYMVYGLAFMLLQPVFPIFLVDEIKIQYSQAAVARGLVFWGVISLAAPLFGGLLDRWNAVVLSAIGFAILVLAPLGLALSHSIWPVYGSFAIWGLGLAPIQIAWTMGPILFARNRDAATYMGVHVTMVGLRGLVGNPLGLFLLETVGSRAAFLVSSALFALSAVLMWRLNRRMVASAAANL